MRARGRASTTHSVGKKALLCVYMCAPGFGVRSVTMYIRRRLGDFGCLVAKQEIPFAYALDGLKANSFV